MASVDKHMIIASVDKHMIIASEERDENIVIRGFSRWLILQYNAAAFDSVTDRALFSDQLSWERFCEKHRESIYWVDATVPGPILYMKSEYYFHAPRTWLDDLIACDGYIFGGNVLLFRNESGMTAFLLKWPDVCSVGGE